jgi:hypothetical protein
MPEGLAAVLERMMAKAPAERYQTPAEVAEALAPWTQTPIPLPAPEEMPSPSLAGPGAGPAEATPNLPVSLYPLAPTPTPASTRESAADVSLAAQPSATPTAVMTAKSAVTRPPPPGARREAAQPRPAGKARRRWAAAALVALAVVAGGAGLAAYKMKNPGGTPAPGPSAAPRLRLLVPAYFYPAGDGLAEWNRLIESSAPAATVVIANPASGPGEKADPNYVKILERARAKGVVVLGYVTTKYADRQLHEVKADVDRWVRFYPGTQGIFLDEQASGADKVLYYAALHDYVRNDRGLSLVVGNPGTVCAEEYFARPAVDIACLVETAKDLSAYHRPPWADRYPPSHFAALASKIESAERMKQAVQEIVANKIGYCYVTDGQGANPWDRLPRYWEVEVAAVRQVNEQGGP